MEIKLGSLFDGIGGFPLAGQRHGITPVWASEIEKNPVEITKKHFPNIKHLGDITKINGAEIEPVDVITFGSPCQDLSVAGKRAGLEGERSGLFMEAVRIIREMRGVTNGKYPRLAVWENVPGAFSSAKGNDFRAVLEEITESEIPMPPSGRWATSGVVRGNGIEAAWRVLDAQYWGVPQRRKRIFLVADFRGTSAAEILFVEKGLRGDFAEGRKERQGTARGAAAGTGEGAKRITFSNAGFSNYKAGSIAACQRAGIAKQSDTDVVLEPITLSKVSSTLRAVAGAPKHEADEKGRLILEPITLAQRGCGTGISRPAGMASETDLVVASIDYRNCCENSEITATLQSGGIGVSLNSIHPVCIGYKVRRLTPTECERLQGFPDGWTDGFSDTARYKALGNSVAVPCVEFVMKGIVSTLCDNQ